MDLTEFYAEIAPTLPRNTCPGHAGTRTSAGVPGFSHEACASGTSVVTHTFTGPGTYFPSVRVTNQRSVDAGTPHCRILNLGRVRVVVR